MKKYLLPLLAGVAVAFSANAALILNETFGYPDGSLTAAAGSVWTNHSGTAGQVDVGSGRVNLTQSESEDVNTGLADAPYNGPTLYASFLVNFSLLPSGTGGYFAHFKDTGTLNLKARVFASISGAAAGTFRVGIANSGSSPTYISRDLALNTDYLLVVRYETSAATPATLWINPVAESATDDRAVAADANTAVGMYTFALRQSLSSGNGMGTLTLDDLKVGTAFGDVVSGTDPSLNPPSIASIPDQFIPANGAMPAVAVTVNDGETTPDSLTLSTASSNPGLIPVSAVVFGGSGSNRTVTVTPTSGQQGFSEITVTVADSDGNTASRNFLIVVGAPTITFISNQTTPKDIPTAAIPFTVADPEGNTLIVTASSTNETVVPVGNIVFGGSGPNRNITITPAAGQAGLSRVTLFVSDGYNTASNSFVLTVFPTAGVLFSDTFSYPDGSLVPNSSFVWNTHSGSNAQTQVIEGKVHMSGSQSEDFSAFLGVQSYPAGGGWILYCAFTVNFSARPTASGDYFAHFKNAASSFGCKVFSVTTGAAAGKLRLGVSNNANSPSAILPFDLETNVTYTVVTRMNVGTGGSTLWINPASEGSTSVTATDSAFPFEVFTYAFRQTAGIGDLVVDDIKTGTAFSDVVTPGYSLTIINSGNDVQISWPAAAAGFVLQVSTDLQPANWLDSNEPVSVQGDRNIVRLFGTTGYQFLRLKMP